MCYAVKAQMVSELLLSLYVRLEPPSHAHICRSFLLTKLANYGLRLRRYRSSQVILRSRRILCSILSRSINSPPMSKSAKLTGLVSGSTFRRAFSSTGCHRAPRASQLVAATTTVRRGNPIRQPRDENVAGDFYVDHTCIGKGLLDN